MAELPKKLKIAHKQKTVLTVKKHIHNILEEPTSVRIFELVHILHVCEFVDV